MNTIINQKKKSYIGRLAEDIKKHKTVYLMAIPVLLYFIVFKYGPMYGAIIAFKDYNPASGIAGSPWVGFKHFVDFFNSADFTRIVKNTLAISIGTLIFSFPIPIIFALLLNEIRSKAFSRFTQTITYLPHFISMVIICGMIKDFTTQDGLITQILVKFGMPAQNMLNNKDLFVPIYIVSDMWQTFGWGSIVYLAALSGVEQSLYEAASIDGAGKLRQVWSITIPAILPTIITMLILRVGGLVSVGHEKIILLYNPLTYEKADVISSYVYRRGLNDFAWSFSTAVGLVQSLVNCILLLFTNYLSNKLTETSLW